MIILLASFQNRILIQASIVLLIGISLILGLLFVCIIKDINPNTIVPYLITKLIVPFFEELLFRFPIILFFNKLTIGSIIVSLIISINFGFLHRNNIEKNQKLFSLKRDTVCLSKKIILVSKISLLAFVWSLAGIYYNSLFIPVLLHFAWNFKVICFPIIKLFVKKGK